MLCSVSLKIEDNGHVWNKRRSDRAKKKQPKKTPQKKKNLSIADAQYLKVMKK